MELIIDIAKWIAAIGVISAAAIAIYKRFERILLWALKRFYGHAGGLRIIKAASKGGWTQQDENTAMLSCDWYAASLLDRPIQILTVEMRKPKQYLDGTLIQRGRTVPLGVPAGCIHVHERTAKFEVRFDIPMSYMKGDGDFKVEIVFTDSFNNPHRKKVTFACASD